VSSPIGPDPVTSARRPVRERLGAGQLEQIGIVRHRQHLIPAQHEMLGEPALDVREAPGAAEEEHVCAQVVAPGAALAAGEARPAGIERRLHAGREPDHRAADLDHRAGDFVAERHRLAQGEIADRAAMIIMHVRSADAAIGDGDAHLVRGERTIGQIVDPQILASVANRCEHEPILLLLPVSSEWPSGNMAIARQPGLRCNFRLPRRV
jgi:hypothetical protein